MTPTAPDDRPPPNPFFTREYVWPLPVCNKPLKLTIPAPGGEVSRRDAEAAVGILTLVCDWLREEIARAAELERTV